LTHSRRTACTYGGAADGLTESVSLAEPATSRFLAVADALHLDPPILVSVRGIVVREVDQPALIVPHVFAVNDDAVSGRERDALADVDVVVDEKGLR
jgi:hypothetical protein